MRIAVTGASGNVGTSVLRALIADEAVSSIVGIARRQPEWQPPKVEWACADVAVDRIDALLKGADVLIHLAWAIQPSRDEERTHAVNVTGSERVFDAAAAAGVGAVVHASSIGAYSPGSQAEPVDESWPTEGVRTSFYSRHKAAAEAILDRFEAAHPEVRVVRLRPGLIFKASAGSEIRRLFGGPLVPAALLKPGRLPLVPWIAGLRTQAVHSDDVAEGYRLAATGDARGAFNLAAEPVLDPTELGRLLGAKPVPMPAAALRAGAKLTWQAHLQPTSPDWLDLALGIPIMDVSRARDELGWAPRHSSGEALLELLEGMRESDGVDTPPLSPRSGGPLRIREFLTGVGRTSR